MHHDANQRHLSLKSIDLLPLLFFWVRLSACLTLLDLLNILRIPNIGLTSMVFVPLPSSWLLAFTRFLSG